MKKFKKIFSIAIAIMMLLQLFTYVHASEGANASGDGSLMPDNLKWSDKNPGSLMFNVPDPAVLPDHFYYEITVYKDNEKVGSKTLSINKTEFGATTVKSHSCTEEIIVANGSGTYKYTLSTVDSKFDILETTGFSEEFVYTKPEKTLSVPTDIVFNRNEVRWTPVFDENCDSYWITYYITYPNGEVIRSVASECKNESSDDVENWVYQSLNQEVESRHNTNSEKYDKNTAVFAVKVRALSNDITVACNSEDSELVKVTEAENIFKFSLKNYEGKAGEKFATDNIYYYVPQSMQFGLLYASTDYKESINKKTVITFTKSGVSKDYTLDTTPLTYNDYDDYSINFTVPSDLETGTYTLKIELDVANEKENEDVKPYVITIKEFKVLGTPDFEFVGITEFEKDGDYIIPLTKNKTVTVKFNKDIMDSYTSYYIYSEDSWKEYPITSDTFSVNLDTKQGFQDVSFAFGGNPDKGEKFVEIFKSIIYDCKNKLIFKVNGQQVGEALEFNVGDYLGYVQYPEAEPSLEGYRFEGWEKIPQTMPDYELVINAIMTKMVVVTGKVLSNELPCENATVEIKNTIYTTQTDKDGKFTLTVPCGNFMLDVSKDTMKKSVSVSSDDFKKEIEDIVLSSLGSSVTFEEQAVKTVDGLENVISDEDEEYLKTPGNTITVNASAKTVASNSGVQSQIDSNYSSYTASIMIDLTLEKVKAGEESSTTAVTQTDEVVAFKVEIPSIIADKDEYIVLREHSAQYDVLSTTPNADGEYIKVENGIITIYAKKFSVYTLLAKDVETPSYTVTSSGGGSSTGYNVKFVTNSTKTIKSQYVKKDGFAVKPENPEKEGYSFDGWYTDKNLTTKFDFGTKITKSITLYAKWVKGNKTSIVLVIGNNDVVVNGETKTNDVAPVIVNDRTMLPIRFIAEALGAEVEWDEATRTVTVSIEDTKISVVIGEDKAKVNDKETELDSPAFIENSRTFLPVRFIAENLGANIEWDEENQKVTIEK